MFASKHRKCKLSPLVNRWVVPGLSRLSKSLCVQSLCAFFLPYRDSQNFLQVPRTEQLATALPKMLVRRFSVVFYYSVCVSFPRKVCIMHHLQLAVFPAWNSEYPIFIAVSWPKLRRPKKWSAFLFVNLVHRFCAATCDESPRPVMRRNTLFCSGFGASPFFKQLPQQIVQKMAPKIN